MVAVFKIATNVQGLPQGWWRCSVSPVRKLVKYFKVEVSTKSRLELRPPKLMPIVAKMFIVIPSASLAANPMLAVVP